MSNYKLLFWFNLIFIIFFSCKSLKSKNDDVKTILASYARVKKEFWIRYRNFKCYDTCIRKVQAKKNTFSCTSEKNINVVKKMTQNFTNAADTIRKQQPTSTVQRAIPGYHFFIRSTLHNLDTCNSNKYTCGPNILYPKGSSNMRNTTIICGKKQYFISVKSTVNAQAWSTCCGAGYVPAVIESRTELDCLKSLFASRKIYPNRFLVSAVDLNLTRNFVSCPTNSKVPADIWSPGQPDNVGGMEPCAYLSICHTCNDMGLHDSACLNNLPVLCQKIIVADSESTTENENDASGEDVTPQ